MDIAQNSATACIESSSRRELSTALPGTGPMARSVSFSLRREVVRWEADCNVNGWK